MAFWPLLLVGCCWCQLTGAVPIVPSARKEKRFPDAIIIGVKKAGTRALLEFLRLNPRVVAPGPEIHFFDKHFDKGFEWYRDQMPATSLDEITIEKSPAYFVKRDAPARIRALNPKMKLILVVRDPVTRAISDYTQSSTKRKRRGLDPNPAFERMAIRNCSPLATSNCSDTEADGVNSSWGAIRIGVYEKYLKRWLEFFPLEQFHFVDGERLIANPAEEVNAVERFLGLEPVVHTRDFAVDPVKGFPCVRKSNGQLRCLGATKGRRHPLVRNEVLDKLYDFYAPHNEEFFRIVHKRFAW